MQIKPNTEGEKEYVEVPNLVGSSCEYAANALKALGLQMELEGTGTVVSQVPARGEQVEKYSIIKIKGDTPVDTTTYYGLE